MYTILFFPVLISLFNLLPLRSYIHEITTSAGVYLLLHHIVVLVALFWIQRSGRRILSGRMARGAIYGGLLISIAFYLGRLAPFYISPERGSESRFAGKRFRVYYSNVHTGNVKFDFQRRAIERSQADLVALLETSSRWLEELSLEHDFPYHLTLPAEDNFGVSLYSKYPFTEQARIEQGEGKLPVILAPVRFETGTVMVVVMHTMPPYNAEAYHYSRVTLRRVATFLRNYRGAVIVAGDLNTSPFSRLYTGFQRGAALHHAFWGYGYRRTWNPRNPLLYFMVDHVLYKGELQVEAANRLEDVGSDHYPLLVDFLLQSSNSDAQPAQE